MGRNSCEGPYQSHTVTTLKDIEDVFNGCKTKRYIDGINIIEFLIEVSYSARKE